jgi:hypothetical protein
MVLEDAVVGKRFSVATEEGEECYVMHGIALEGSEEMGSGVVDLARTRPVSCYISLASSPILSMAHTTSGVCEQTIINIRGIAQDT